MHPTGGSRRVFGQFPWLEARSVKAAWSRPPHPRVTQSVGHSAGGTALIIAASLLVRDGHGDQINNLVLLDPYIGKKSDQLYPSDEKGTIGNIQEIANSLAASGVTVFLGDSPGDEEDQQITGAIEHETGRDVDHLELANDLNTYNYFITHNLKP